MNKLFGIGLSIIALPFACGVPNASPTIEATLSDSLVGTWRVIAQLPEPSPSAEPPRPRGSEPRGYLVYDQTGHVLWQVLRRGAADSLRVRSWAEVPDSILKPLLAGFQAYFGTYAVDESARLVTHRLEGEFLPRAGQIEVATPFRLRGDTLTLGADSLERWVFVRVR